MLLVCKPFFQNLTQNLSLRKGGVPLKRFTVLKELWLQTATVSIAKSHVTQAAFCRLFYLR